MRADEVCVIGAGGAGLAAAQALASRGLPFTVFEAGSGVGGTWRYENDNGRSSAYASLRTNTSRQRTSYRCYRLRKRGSFYLHHTEMLSYLEGFTDFFALRQHVRFSCPVTAVRPSGDGDWEVWAGNDDARRFRAVVVATGYESVPVYPVLPGRFGGVTLHAHDYRTPTPFRDLDVVVIGLGCSATELACEIGRVAASVTIACRSGNWVHPRRLGPMPLDWFGTRVASHLPWSLRRRLFKLLIRLAGGDQVAAPGQPAVRVGDKPFTVTDELIRAVRRREIRLTGPVVELASDHVRVADGAELAAGALLYATGYRAEFPFLPDALEHPTIDAPRLYRGVAHPRAPGLFFIGLVAGHGALIPMFEAQAGWVGTVLADELTLPSEDVMYSSVACDDEVRARDFDPRFGVLWDRLAYVRALEAEARRARREAGVSPGAEGPTVC